MFSRPSVNGDHAVRFVSEIVLGEMLGQSVMERAISVLPCCITGTPRSMAAETAKY
jgi:hypothetical protein